MEVQGLRQIPLRGAPAAPRRSSLGWLLRPHLGAREPPAPEPLQTQEGSEGSGPGTQLGQQESRASATRSPREPPLQKGRRVCAQRTCCPEATTSRDRQRKVARRARRPGCGGRADRGGRDSRRPGRLRGCGSDREERAETREPSPRDNAGPGGGVSAAPRGSPRLFPPAAASCRQLLPALPPPPAAAAVLSAGRLPRVGEEPRSRGGGARGAAPRAEGKRAARGEAGARGPDGRPALLRARPTPSPPRPLPRPPDWREALQQEQQPARPTGRAGRRSPGRPPPARPLPAVGPSPSHSASSSLALLWRTGNQGSPSRPRKANFILIGKRTSSCAPDWARQEGGRTPRPIAALPSRGWETQPQSPPLALPPSPRLSRPARQGSWTNSPARVGESGPGGRGACNILSTGGLCPERGSRAPPRVVSRGWAGEGASQHLRFWDEVLPTSAQV
ncbi:unnamed protein product [Nyctereutes procyonoides]|uniref:(raccoon dog) hypothetical protein n=1 Tax=Nyctereutes procyonoides TaxID=34880 RepID=A0A811XWJ0_NYCPR|nr:unnamed protein product [Nyctereutes procyonoides]